MMIIDVQRDFVICFGTRVERPEKLVPGDWLDMWDRFEKPVDYQEAFEAGVESVEDDLADEIKGLESEVYDLKEEVRSLENEVENLEIEIERLGGTVE